MVASSPHDALYQRQTPGSFGQEEQNNSSSHASIPDLCHLCALSRQTLVSCTVQLDTSLRLGADNRDQKMVFGVLEPIGNILAVCLAIPTFLFLVPLSCCCWPLWHITLPLLVFILLLVLIFSHHTSSGNGWSTSAAGMPRAQHARKIGLVSVW